VEWKANGRWRRQFQWNLHKQAAGANHLAARLRISSSRLEGCGDSPNFPHRPGRWREDADRGSGCAGLLESNRFAIGVGSQSKPMKNHLLEIALTAASLISAIVVVWWGIKILVA
jgi:hypothetical protein